MTPVNEYLFFSPRSVLKAIALSVKNTEGPGARKKGGDHDFLQLRLKIYFEEYLFERERTSEHRENKFPSPLSRAQVPLDEKKKEKREREKIPLKFESIVTFIGKRNENSRSLRRRLYDYTINTNTLLLSLPRFVRLPANRPRCRAMISQWISLLHERPSPIFAAPRRDRRYSRSMSAKIRDNSTEFCLIFLNSVH